MVFLSRILPGFDTEIFISIELGWRICSEGFEKLPYMFIIEDALNCVLL